MRPHVKLAGDFRATVHWVEADARYWIWVDIPIGYWRHKPDGDLKVSGPIFKVSAPPHEQIRRELDPTLPTNADRIRRALKAVTEGDMFRAQRAADSRKADEAAASHRAAVAVAMREALHANGFTQPAADDVLFTLYQRVLAIKGA